MAPLTIHLLGPPTVQWEGEYLNLPRKRVRGLLFRLAVDMQPVARENLASLFWADASDGAAHRELTHLLTHLRSALPEPGIVQSTADFIFLDPRFVWTDTAAFLSIFQPTVPPLTTVHLIEAMRLYRGELLEGFYLDGCAEYEEWLTIERSIWERRASLLISAIERSAEATKDVALAIHSARFLLRSEPLDVDAHCRLVEAQLAHGNQAALKRHYDAVRALLPRDEPGTV